MNPHRPKDQLLATANGIFKGNHWHFEVAIFILSVKKFFFEVTMWRRSMTSTVILIGPLLILRTMLDWTSLPYTKYPTKAIGT